MDSATDWYEDGCCIDVELGTGGLDDLEGGVHGFVINWCQGCEQEFISYGVGVGHGGNDEETVIRSWDILGRKFLSHTEDRGKGTDYSALLVRSTDKEIS